MPHDTDMNRRRLLALAGASLGAGLAGLASGSAVAQRASAGGARAGAFFTAQEFELLDEIAEMIVPADANSGGAKAAKVAAYIDARAAESLDVEFQKSWREDLAEIDRLANEMFGRRFVAAKPEERGRLLDRISRNEGNPKLPGEYSFGTIKWQVTYCYYKTQIGIHDELKYKGNQVLDAFEGLEPWKT